MSTIHLWYDQQQFSKSDAEKYYKDAVMVNSRKTPFIVVDENPEKGNVYQIIFGIDQEHAEWIAVKEFGFFNPIALHFESIENFRDAKDALNLLNQTKTKTKPNLKPNK